MKPAPLVSVILPFKDRHHWVRESCRSVLNQEFKNFELILVDDGSLTELDAPEIFEDPRVRHFKQKNRGVSAARNRGVKEAKGLYIAFLDSDDLFHPKKLGTQIDFMLSHPNAVISHTPYYRFSDSIGKDLRLVDTSNIEGNVFPWIVSSCPIATPCVMMKKELMLEYLFDEDLSLMEDLILWIRIAAKHPIYYIDEPLSYIRIHGMNAGLVYADPLNHTKLCLSQLEKHGIKVPLLVKTVRLFKSFLLRNFKSTFSIHALPSPKTWWSF